MQSLAQQNITQLTELTEQEIATIEGGGPAGTVLMGVTAAAGTVSLVLGAPLVAGFFAGMVIGEGLTYLWSMAGTGKQAPSSNPAYIYYYYYYDPAYFGYC